MRMTGDAAFRTLRPSAAILLLTLSVSCDQEPAGLDAPTGVSRPPIQRVARARVIEPGEPADLTPPSVAAWSTVGIADLLNAAFDVDGKRLWIIASGTSQLMEMRSGPDGRVDLGSAERIDAQSLRLRGPRGLTFDPRSQRLFVLDAGPRILRLEPHPVMGFSTPAISVIDLTAAGLSQARGIAFDGSSGHLHVMDPVTQLLHEITDTGEIVASRDLSEFGFHDIQGMAFAPTRDPTDDPARTGLFISSGGKVTELSFAVTAAATATATATLVRTTLTSEFSPSSPDPSGIAYAVHQGKLIIVDGEVEEMTIWSGKNVFETSLSGSLSRSWSTTSFSIEPVGAAYNSVNRHLFISDDDDRRIFDLDPGPDGAYGTADDQVMWLDSRLYGSDDPEGLAYDAANRVLFIADGVGAEVYRIAAGNNGIFDGPPPAGDDEVTHFDTWVHGLTDPEGIAFDFDFGHLYVSGKPDDIVFHFSQSGVLLRTIDVSAANADNLAGLEYGPSSVNSGARALYIVDRGVDNDSDPDENDGKMYEFSLPPLEGNTLPGVMITAPANGAMFGEDDVITFTGTASDLEDGDLTASLLWASNVDGTFGTGGSVSTSALSIGRHVITASVADGDGGLGAATIDIEVFPVGLGAVQIRIATGSDDIEESASGSVQMSSSDLELVNDGNDQLVGLRFPGVTVPRGATVTLAYVQFQTDEKTSVSTSLSIQGQATDNAQTFSSSNKVSTRTRTTSAVAWAPPAWNTVGQAGADQQTPNLAPVIQEIINRPGWSSGNALALIITGTGVRVAEAYEGDAAGAPMLRVEYTTGLNTVPTATNVTISGTPRVGQLLTGNYTYSDAEGDLEGTSTYRWLRDGTAISGATSRTYTPVTADEGTMIVFEVTPVAATGATPGAAVQSAAVEIMPPLGVSASLSTVTASPTSITSSSGSSTITVTVMDESGAPMSGATVVLSATGDGNTLTQPTSPTNSSGQTTGTFSSTVAGTKTISATANGTAISQTATVEVTQPPPITHSLLTSGVDPINQKVYTTASISPAPNTLITVAVLAHHGSGAPDSPEISGGGMTQWTVMGTLTFDALSLPLKRLTVYRAMSPSPGSGPITFTFPRSQSHALWIVSQWDGVDISGVNGEGAIVQGGSLAADEVNGLTLDLAPFSHVNNVAYGVFAVRWYHPAVTPGSGFIEIADLGSIEGPPSALQAEWKLDDNSIDATWNNLRGAVLGFEIRAR